MDITKDAQFGEAGFNYKKCESIRSYVPKPKLVSKDLQDAADLINTASNPFLLVGQGILLSEAEDVLLAFAEKTGIPVASTLLGLGAFPSDHPLYVGYLGMHGNYAPNLQTNECDVLIAIGMRFDDRVTGDVDRYAKQAKVLHVDIDKAELNKIVEAELGIHGDARAVLMELLPLVEQNSHDNWVREFRILEEQEKSMVVRDAVQPSSDELRMAEVIYKLSERDNGDMVVVTDVGQHQMVTSRYFRFNEKRTNVTSGGLGTMGFGLPAGIGAKYGAPHKKVVVVMGDGGYQMTIQELGTIMQFGVDVKLLVLNNNFLGMVRQWQQMFFDRRYSFTDIQNPDFVQIAKGYGIYGEKIEERYQLDQAMDKWLNSEESSLLEVVVEKEDNVFPMMPTGASVSEVLLSEVEL